MYETRSAKPVTADSWTYMEAPLAQMLETRTEIDKLGIGHIPLFPTELVELQMRSRHISELTKPKQTS